MKIVIDIPDEMYDWLDNGFPDEDDAERLWQVVKNGTPLPKGHGRLIDADELFDKIQFADFSSSDDVNTALFSISDAPTIIDKEETT